MKLILKDESATLAFGARLYHAIKAGCQIHLSGDLGVGKTTLVRGFLRASGYEGAVKSPTYTLVEEYQLGEQAVVHFDLYRLADEEELEWMGIRDYMNPEVICFIEWPQRAPSLCALVDLSITITASGMQRQLEIVAESAKGESFFVNIGKLNL